MSSNNTENSAAAPNQSQDTETVRAGESYKQDAPKPPSSETPATADNNIERRDTASEQSQDLEVESSSDVHAEPSSDTHVSSLALPAAGQDLLQYLDGFTQTHIPTSTSAPLQFTNNWKGAFDYKRRVVEVPYRPPGNDPTIMQVLADREYWVGEFYMAMINLEDVKDRAGSYERRRMEAGKYDKRQLEAVCREIFVALIDQVTSGYRGHRKEAVKPIASEKADREGDCLTRAKNVAKALKEDKRVCRDVMTDDSRIPDLVYAPLFQARSKLDNAANNNQKKEKVQINRAMADRLIAEKMANQPKATLGSVPNSGIVVNKSATPNSRWSLEGRSTPSIDPSLFGDVTPISASPNLPALAGRKRSRKNASEPAKKKAKTGFMANVDTNRPPADLVAEMLKQPRSKTSPFLLATPTANKEGTDHPVEGPQSDPNPADLVAAMLKENGFTVSTPTTPSTQKSDEKELE